MAGKVIKLIQSKTRVDIVHEAAFASEIDVPRWASLVAQMVTHPSAKQEIQVQSLSPEDTLVKEMATHFSILARRIPWTEQPGWHSPWDRKESEMVE